MKKRNILFLSFLTFGVGLLLSGISASAVPSANLITNASLEASSGSPAAPTGWTSNAWGSNTATFQYLNSGRTGSKSVQTQVTAYTDGDAKWSANPVSVTPGTQYTYSGYYKSNTPTRFVVEFSTATGGLSYTELAAAAASPTNWTQAVRSFTPPAGTSTVRVYHLVSTVGYLTIDDVSLTYEVAPPTSGNLVTNPSLETSSGSPLAPVGWLSNKWGTNTATFSYLSNGRTGSRSAQVQITAYTNGDAKWYFEPITVQPNKSYDISHYYKSNAITRTVLVTYDAMGNPTYSDMTASVPASSSVWTQTTKTITTPANATRLTVFHVIERVGRLQIDDMSVVATPVSPTPTNPVANPSLEAASGSPALPTSWTSNSYGVNSPTFQYVTNDGQHGTRSAKITMANYVDGDAKWYPQPISLTPGQSYRYTVWYKTNVEPKAVVMFNMSDGTQKYFGMPQPLPAANAATAWQKYTETFIVPQGVASVSPFLFIAANGFLQVDNVTIENYSPTGFARPLVTLTFDDGHEDNASTALPAMNARGFDSTQCFATQYIQNNAVARQAVLNFRDSGHEICSHTITHPFLTKVSPSQLTVETRDAQAYLKELTSTPVKNFASPYGDYNAAVNTELRKYYRSHRTVDEGFNSKDNFDMFRVRVQNMTPSTTLAEYQGWIDYAKATNTWLVLVYHRIPQNAASAGPFDTPYTNFVQQMDALQASNVTVKTYDAALDELTAQLP